MEPNTNEEGSRRDAVFGLAQDAGSVDDGEQIRRTITMVRNSVESFVGYDQCRFCCMGCDEV